MNKKYLLYIDILGFKNLISQNEERIRKLYSIIDNLNSHQHPNYKTIVFSDTILIYNTFDPDENNFTDNSYFVMYSIEFAQDLQSRLIGSDIYFRAQLRYDYFEHFNLKNTQCFFGNNLITSYEQESNIPAIGIFKDNHCLKFNDIFPSERFSDDLSFVFINQSLERLHRNTSGVLPTDNFHLEGSDEYWDILWDINYLKNIYQKSISEKNPLIRTKYANTWAIFQTRYKKILHDLERNNFDPNIICPTYNWNKMKERFNEDQKRTKI